MIMKKPMNMTTLLATTVGVTLIGAYAFLADTTLGNWPGFQTPGGATSATLDAREVDVTRAVPVSNRNAYYQQQAARRIVGAQDVMAIDAGFVGAFVDAGRFENLSDPAYDAGQLADSLIDAAWQQGQGADGRQYAIPVEAGPRLLYFRRDIAVLHDTDIADVVTSWQSYVAYGRALRDQGIYLVADAADVADLIIATTMQDGEGLYFDSDGQSLLTSNRFVTAFQIARTLREEGLDGQIAELSPEWYDAFNAGAVATHITGSWQLAHLQHGMTPDIADMWAASVLPNGAQGSWGVTFLAIPKEADNKQAVWDFITAMAPSDQALAADWKTKRAGQSLRAKLVGASDADMTHVGDPQTRMLFAEVLENDAIVGHGARDLLARDIVAAALADVLDDGKGIMVALTEAENTLTQSYD